MNGTDAELPRGGAAAACTLGAACGEEGGEGGLLPRLRGKQIPPPGAVELRPPAASLEGCGIWWLGLLARVCSQERGLQPSEVSVPPCMCQQPVQQRAPGLLAADLRLGGRARSRLHFLPSAYGFCSEPGPTCVSCTFLGLNLEEGPSAGAARGPGGLRPVARGPCSRPWYEQRAQRRGTGWLLGVLRGEPRPAGCRSQSVGPHRVGDCRLTFCLPEGSVCVF